ncbi:MAG TPA: glycosyltransferase [Armatimonadota bacterium]
MSLLVSVKRVVKRLAGKSERANEIIETASRVLHDAIFAVNAARVNLITAVPEATEKVDAALPIGFNISGYAYGVYGLSHSLRGTARGIEAIPLPYVINNIDPREVPPAEFVSDRLSLENPYRFNLLHFNPDSLKYLVSNVGRSYFAGRYNIGFWFWETPTLPKQWVDFKGAFHEIWTASEFVRQAVEKSTHLPTINVGQVIEVDESELDLDRACFNLPKDEIVFLSYFDYQALIARKNPVGMIDAFKKAFPNENNVRLIIKTMHGELPTCAEDRAVVEAAAADDPRIQLISTVLTRREMMSLVKCSDCVVSLHRSEGFGLSMAEAMALGKPVIATSYSGNMDFMTEQNSFLVRYSPLTTTRAYGQFPKGTVWADPDTDHAAELMRFVSQNPTAASAAGKRAAQDISDLYSAERVGKRIMDRIKVICA